MEKINTVTDVERMMSACCLCPRACGADRANGMKGRCGVTGEVKVARAALHMWEEPCLSGKRGSGTIFFAGCNMGCVFCQNHEISQNRWGKDISLERLAEIFFELAAQGAANINLVTPDHYIPQLAYVLRKVKAQGFSLPIVYNSSAYVQVEALRLLEGLVDIYLPDFKYIEMEPAKQYSHAEDYPHVAKKAVSEMVRQIRAAAEDVVCVFDSDGMMKRGVIVRHLLLPGQLYSARRIVRYLYQTYGSDIYISLMNQYTPMEQGAGLDGCLRQQVSADSYENLIEYARRLGVKQGYMQEGNTAKESFIPPFDLAGV